MSLDVYLTIKDRQKLPEAQAIFIREDGENREISWKEWDERYPDQEPMYVTLPSDDEEVYSANITHNLNRMAGHAGNLYEALWRPEDIDATVANDLIPYLEEGLSLLKNDPEKYREYNPPNGWGDYNGLVRFTTNYLKACREYPKAEVYVSR